MSTSSTDRRGADRHATGEAPASGRHAVVAGEALVDVVVPTSGQQERAPGGSPLNVAVGLSRLGVDTLLVAELGDDEDGRLVEAHVRASGVRLHPPVLIGGRRTSTATARLDPTGAATYDFDLRWDLGPVELPDGTDALHIGSLGALLRPASAGGARSLTVAGRGRSASLRAARRGAAGPHRGARR